MSLSPNGSIFLEVAKNFRYAPEREQSEHHDQEKHQSGPTHQSWWSNACNDKRAKELCYRIRIGISSFAKKYGKQGDGGGASKSLRTISYGETDAKYDATNST